MKGVSRSTLHVLTGKRSYEACIKSHFVNIPSQRSLFNPAMQLMIADGEDRDELTKALPALLECGWQLDENNSGVRKIYHLKTYTKVLDLHHSIGVGSKSKNHHPEMTTKSGSLAVHWTTHHPRGLSAKDIFMAKYCDEVARTIGTVDELDAQRCGPNSSQTK
ncbi:MAG: hypothetical protein L6R36_005968 [Xanthoria steineri]|nr:MAG: hypothetical protein L6R36_005968 [Xanthoria steineri]